MLECVKANGASEKSVKMSDLATDSRRVTQTQFKCFVAVIVPLLLEHLSANK